MVSIPPYSLKYSSVFESFGGSPIGCPSWCSLPSFYYIYFVGRLIDDDEEEEIPDKSKVQYEHMRRVRAQMAAEEEALKNSRIVKGVDKKKYKDIKYRKHKEEIPDEQKLELMRSYQFLIGFLGLIAVGIIIWGIKIPVLRLAFSRTFVIEIDLIFMGCLMAIVCVIGIIGFQHKHDRISDRIIAKERLELGIRRRYR